MDGSAKAAEATAGKGIGRVLDVAAGQQPGAFRGRGVSRSPGQPPEASVRDSREAGATAFSPGGRASVRSRSAKAGLPSGGSTQAEDSVGNLRALSSGGAAEGAGRTSDSGPRWLTRERKAALQESNAHLDVIIQCMTDSPMRDDLREVVRMVRQAENEVVTTERLLRKSRTGSLSDAEWREMRYLSAKCLLDTAPRWILVDNGVDRLMEHCAVGATEKRLVNDLQQRLDDAFGYWRVHRASWMGAGRRVEMTSPTPGGRQVAVESRVVPGIVLGAHFAGGYPSEESRKGPGAARYSHVPGLSATALVNDGGELLFSGLRHDLFVSGELDMELVAKLPADQLEPMIGALFATKSRWESPDSWRERVIHECSAIIRSRGALAPGIVSKMREVSDRLASTETMAAALVVSPSAMQEALNGASIGIKLFSIALLMPDDVEMWRRQYEHFLKFGDKGVLIDVDVCDRLGEPRKVSVAAFIRQFAFIAGDDPASRECSRRVNRESLERLLGSLDSPDPGGDIKKDIDRNNATIVDLSHLQHSEKSVYRRWVQALGQSDRKTVLLRRGLDVRDALISEGKRSASALERIGKQLKAMLTAEGDWPVGADAQREAAARLALVGFLMNEMPLLTCAGGRGLTERLESEVKFLAAVTDSDNGRPPGIGLDMELWGCARAAFGPPSRRTGHRGRPARTPAEPAAGPVFESRDVSIVNVGGRCRKSRFDVNLLREVPTPKAPDHTG